MITVILLCLPFVAAVYMLLSKTAFAKQIALTAAVAELLVGVFAAINFTPDASIQFLAEQSWMPSLGINFKVGMDGISLLLVLLTVFLFPLIIFSSFNKNFSNSRILYALLLLTQSGLLGVFVSLNGFLFYLFWEVVLIPIYFLSAIWGGQNRVRATLKFFIYTIAGSFFMLLAFIYLYLQTPDNSFDLQSLYNLHLDRTTQAFIFWGFFIAFAIKMPVFPFHTWQPDIYSEAPVSTTMILASLMGKMALYGVLRFILPITPLAIEDWGSTAIVLSVIGIVYASCLAIVQKDLKRLIAYASIAHIGLISAGIFTLNSQGLQGGVFQMLCHGINAVGLFFIIDIIYTRTNTVEFSKLGGIATAAPKFAIAFMIIMVSTFAMPLTNSFWGEFLLLLGIFQYNPYLAVISGLTIILGSVYLLRMYQKSIFGANNDLTKNFTDLNFSEKIILIPIVVMILLMGFYPKLFLEIAAPALENLLKIVSH